MAKNLNAKNKKKLANAQTLPIDFGNINTSKVTAADFISRLQSKGFISKNKAYLNNYINSDMSIAMAHIKNNYITYVIDGNWSEEKFEAVLYEIIKRNFMLVPKSFFKMGLQFDNGKIKLNDKLEIPKEKEYTEDELIAYILANGGGDD